VLAGCLGSRTAVATPQASLGFTAGGAVETQADGGPHGAATFGAVTDVLFGRDRGADMAVGPYLDVATLGFHGADLGAGAEWLIPVRDELPLVLSGGAFVREGQGRSWAPGADGAVFFGSRSFNFHSWYGMATGLFVETRFIPAAPSSYDFVFGVRIDAEILALPALLVLGLFK